jgi:hypothetical protein
MCGAHDTKACKHFGWMCDEGELSQISFIRIEKTQFSQLKKEKHGYISSSRHKKL